MFNMLLILPTFPIKHSEWLALLLNIPNNLLLKPNTYINGCEKA